jgi:hypothetical protein
MPIHRASECAARRNVGFQLGPSADQDTNSETGEWRGDMRTRRRACIGCESLYVVSRPLRGLLPPQPSSRLRLVPAARRPSRSHAGPFGSNPPSRSSTHAGFDAGPTRFESLPRAREAPRVGVGLVSYLGRRGRDSNPSSSVGETFKRYATLRAGAATRKGKMGRIALSAGARESTRVDWSWAMGGQRTAAGSPALRAAGAFVFQPPRHESFAACWPWRCA